MIYDTHTMTPAQVAAWDQALAARRDEQAHEIIGTACAVALSALMGLVFYAGLAYAILQVLG